MKGGDVLDHLGASADHGVAADAAELVDSGEATDDDVVFDGHVSGEGGHVGHDDVVADLDVVREMRVGEEVVVGTNDGGLAVRRCGVDRAVLAEDVVVADADVGDAAAILQVLGFSAETGEGKDLVVRAQDRVAFEDNVGVQDGPGSEHDVLSEDAVGSDGAVVGDLGARVEDRGGMDARHGRGGGNGSGRTQRSINMKVTSASETASPLTEQTPRALPILPRDLVISTSMTRVSPGRTGLRHLTSSADMK